MRHIHQRKQNSLRWWLSDFYSENMPFESKKPDPSWGPAFCLVVDSGLDLHFSSMGKNGVVTVWPVTCSISMGSSPYHAK